MHLENIKDSVETLLKLIYKFRNITGYRVNVKNCTSKKNKMLNKFNKMLNFVNILLTVQDVSLANYKTPLKEIKEDVNRWKDMPCLWIRSLNITKMATFPKLFQKINAIPIQNSSFF